MVIQCRNRGEDWICKREDGHSGGHVPHLDLAELEGVLNNNNFLNGALFDIANMFRVPVTNNIPWIDESEKPVFSVTDFIDAIRQAVERFEL